MERSEEPSAEGMEDGSANDFILLTTKPKVAPRLFKPFKPPALVAGRSALVSTLKGKLLRRVDEILKNSPAPEQEELHLVHPSVLMEPNAKSKRRIDSDDDEFPVRTSPPTYLGMKKKLCMMESSLNQCSESDGAATDNQIVLEEDNKKYYGVSWAKITTKKHKTWEEDGILVVNDKHVTMKTSDGKIITSNSNYKLPDEIIPGETEFKFGGKLVGIQEILTTADLDKKSPDLVQIPLTKLPPRLHSKPFICPGGNLVFSGNKEKGKPMFDPEGPNALVMPVPDREHQSLYNKGNDDVVPVVVDPHIARHLRTHQRDGVSFMYKSLHSVVTTSASSGVILADEMGLGKTLQCIALLWTMMKQNPYNNGQKEVKKCLIVTPSSLVKNWEKEFHRWLGAERIRVFGVDSDHPLKECPSQYPVVIISYDMCTRSEEMLKRIKFDLMICDEAHKLKNRNGQAYQLLIALSCHRRVLLTGTPIQNDLSELYSLVNFGAQGSLGSEYDFVKEYERPIAKIQDSNSSALDRQVGELKARELNQIMSTFFLRRDHSVMMKYLPPRVTYVIFCKPTDVQVDIYRKLLLNSVIDTSATLSSILAMKKLCNHPTLLHPKNNNNTDLYNGLGFTSQHRHDQYQVPQCGKLKVLVGMLKKLQEDQEKVVLVSHYTQTLDILEDVCKAFSFVSVRLDGSTQSKQRQGIVDKFNSEYGDSFVFLLSSKAGGIGLNLQGASRIILYDIDWNPAHDMQAMARCWRPGQTRRTHIYRLITTGTIEERIYLRQIKKQDLSGSVMDLLINNPTNFSPEELKDIFSLDATEKCLTHDLMECDCNEDGNNKENDFEEELPEPLTKSKKKKNIPIGELQKWEHFGAPFEDKDLDPALMMSAKDITFIFRNKSDESQSLGQAQSSQ